MPALRTTKIAVTQRRDTIWMKVMGILICQMTGVINIMITSQWDTVQMKMMGILICGMVRMINIMIIHRDIMWVKAMGCLICQTTRAFVLVVVVVVGTMSREMSLLKFSEC